VLTPDRWARVEAIFHEALERPASDRARFVAEACGADEALRREVESLLDADAAEERAPDLAAAAADWEAEAAAASLVGRTLGDYRLLSLLGSGGMGDVFVAEDLTLGRRVAVKMLPAAFGGDSARVRRFAEEARAASALSHPHILTVFHTGSVDGRRFIVTELVDGETLRERLARGPLPVEDALALAAQAASALAASHAAGIVHRDVKPENLMIRRDGSLKIIDFGIAKLAQSGVAVAGVTRTRAGAVVGTPDYMAPEQAAGGAVDARADLYSLGVVLHEMVTGVLPRELSSAGTPAERRSRPPVPAAVRRVLSRALATDPAARYQSAAELERDLVAAAHGVASPRRRWVAAAAALLLVAVLAAVFVLRRRPAAPPSGRVTSLIVMPFKALAGAEQAHLEAGMSEAIVTRLSRLPSLRVPPPAAIKANEDPFEAARRLGVDAVLTGSVQRSGDALRVTAQLSRVSTGDQIWAAHFDETFADIFAIQDAIAERIADNLATRLSPRDRAALERHASANPEAYELYLRAREQWARRTHESIATSIRMYQRAIEMEPGFALAYAGLADAYNLTASGMLPRVRFPLARAAAEKALALDPGSAEAHTALAFCEYKLEWQFADAEREFRTAIALDPKYPLARHWFGEFLKLLGRFDEADAQFRQGLAVDPFSLPLRFDYIEELVEAGQTARARALLEDSLKIDANSARLLAAQADLLDAEGRHAEAVESRARSDLLRGRPESEVDALRAAFRRGGMRAYATEQVRLDLAKLPREASDPPVPELASDLARDYAAAGDRERAIKWLERAADLGQDGPLLMKMRQFATLRGDPRFEALERRIGFAP
jgi:serine/threonine-protein kinase